MKTGAEKKRFKVDIDAALAIDEERRKLQASIDGRKKILGEKSRQIKKETGAGREKLQAELKSFSREIKGDEQRLKERGVTPELDQARVEAALRRAMARLSVLEKVKRRRKL